MQRPFITLSLLFAFLLPASAQITRVVADGDRITLLGRGCRDGVFIAELAPYETTNELASAPVVTQTAGRGRFKLSVPRFDGARDRLYSGFLAFTTNATDHARQPLGGIRFIEEMRDMASYNEPFPRVASKKGLQVQMVDDAIALGVKHAGLNVDLPSLIDLSGNTNNPAWLLDGVTYHFRADVLRGLDGSVKPLSDAGMVVTLILLNYSVHAPEIEKITRHPHYDPAAPNRLGAFNTLTPDGLRWFKATVEFLADRYSQPGHPHGRAVNFIVGNEVNSHWQWANLGPATMEQFAADYLRTVRVCNTAVHKISATSRVYISLEHHWNIRYESDMRSFPGRAFIDYFNRLAIAGGNFDWHLAYHPYPENLREPRSWLDKTPTARDDTPKITFKNLAVLPRYFRRSELRFDGRPRRIILSEQGFDTPKKPDGELWQAAGYCYAYYKIARMDGIDSFILNRHVDHAHEGGLNLGLWRRNPNSASPCEPAGKKLIYEVFRLADTPAWEKAFAFALPVIGIPSWKDIDRVSSR